MWLVRWFGTDVPLDGLRLSVAIDNLDALRAQFGLVSLAQRAAPAGAGGPGGPSLAEPLAGLAGGLAGLVLSPSGSISLVYAAAWVTRGAVAVVLAVLNELTLRPLPLGFGLVLALPITLVVAAVLAADRGLTASLAQLLILVRRFWEQITGPRDRVANPVLRAALDLLDGVAALVPF